MKKNLILMSALFAGAMFMNDGFGVNEGVVNDPLQINREQFIAQSAELIIPQGYKGVLLNTDKKKFDYFIAAVRHVNMYLTAGLAILNDELRHNQQVELMQETYNTFESFINKYNSIRDLYLPITYQNVDNNQYVIEYNNLLIQRNTYEPLIQKKQERQRRRIDYLNENENQYACAGMFLVEVNEQERKIAERRQLEEQEREIAERRQLEEQKMKKIETIKRNVKIATAVSVGGVFCYLIYQYFPVVMPTLTTISSSLIPFFNATGNSSSSNVTYYNSIPNTSTSGFNYYIPVSYEPTSGNLEEITNEDDSYDQDATSNESHIDPNNTEENSCASIPLSSFFKRGGCETARFLAPYLIQ